MAVAQTSLENLKKGKKFTSETAREAGRKGQEKAMQAKRWKKARMELLKMLTGEDVIDDGIFRFLQEHGIGDREMKACMFLMATIGTEANRYIRYH